MAKRAQDSRPGEWTLMKLPLFGYGRHRLAAAGLAAGNTGGLQRGHREGISGYMYTRTPERICRHFTRRSIQDDSGRHWGRHGTHRPVRKRKDGRQEMQVLVQRQVPWWHTRQPSAQRCRSPRTSESSTSHSNSYVATPQGSLTWRSAVGVAVTEVVNWLASNPSIRDQAGGRGDRQRAGCRNDRKIRRGTHTV